MTTLQILSALRAHGHTAFISGSEVITAEQFTQDGQLHSERKAFAAGTSRADLLAWLGY